jgi:arginyl-tRNA synthetase
LAPKPIQTDSFSFRQRVEEEKADWLVYLTDAGQSLHFQCVFACAKKAGKKFSI